MEEQKLTVNEVLKLTVDQLRAISIPAELTESIGLPVLRAIRNLTECIRAMEEAGKAGKEQEDGREADAE